MFNLLCVFDLNDVNYVKRETDTCLASVVTKACLIQGVSNNSREVDLFVFTYLSCLIDLPPLSNYVLRSRVQNCWFDRGYNYRLKVVRI